MDLNFDDEGIRERVRQMLRGRAPGQYRFCDDTDSENPTEAPQLPPRVLSAVRSSNLIDYGCLASTEDRPDQGVEMTVKDDGNFWSSTGSPHDVGEEFLLYKLKRPFAVVRAVEIQVYRAAFQRGGPIYPAKQVLIEVGHSPSTMRTVGGPYTMACTDMPQMFVLPPNLDSAAVGSYAAIRFRGKYQKQHSDDSFYLSMRYVRVLGSTCTPQQALPMRALLVNPSPPPDMLAPSCMPLSLARPPDSPFGYTSSVSRSSPHSPFLQDSSTCVIELPKWAQQEIVQSLCHMSDSAIGGCGGAWRVADGPKGFVACCDSASVSTGWQAHMKDCGDSTTDQQATEWRRLSPSSAQQDPAAASLRGSAAHTQESDGPASMAAGVQASGLLAHPTLWGFNRRRQQQCRRASAGLLDRLFVRGAPLACQPSTCNGMSAAVRGDAESLPHRRGNWTPRLQDYILPPIAPLRTSTEVDVRAPPSCRWLHSSAMQQGPLQHSVDEHGFLRCIVWERTHEASGAQRSCEGADDSEIAASSNAPQPQPQHAPLLLCNQARESIADGIRLVGARKRSASCVGIGSPLKAARESSNAGGRCTVAELNCIMYGTVESVQFAVPLD